MKFIQQTSFFILLILALACKNQETVKVQQWTWLPDQLQDTAIFIPGIVSDTARIESSITFSPNGDSCFFSIRNGQVMGRNNWAIMYTVYKDGAWSTPDTCSFSGKFPDYGPYMSPDGNALYFSSRRPVHDTGTIIKGDYDIWMVQRKGNDWDQPVRLADGINTNTEEYSVAVSHRSVFINARRNDSLGATDMFSVPIHEQFNPFSSFHNVGKPLNDEMWEGGMYVSPDETMLVFQHLVDGEGESEQIKVSYKTDTGWSKPVLLNGLVNTSVHEMAPYVTPDRKFIFFTRHGDIMIAKFKEAQF